MARAPASSRRRLAAAAIVTLSIGCHRATDPGGTTTTAAPIESASATPSAVVEAPPPSSIEPGLGPRVGAPDETPSKPVSVVEAARATIRKVDENRALLAHKDLVVDHYRKGIPTPLETQTALLAGDRRAILMVGGPKERDPFIITVDADDRLLYTKARPLAGIVPGVSEMVLAPSTEGGIALFWFDPPTRSVAARTWNARGLIVADFRVLDVEACENLSVLYWPGQGAVVAAAQPIGAARVQLLQDAGKLGWGTGSRGLPWASRAGAPVTLVLDTDTSVMLIQVGDAGAGLANLGPDHLWVARYDAKGAPLWERPLDAGTVPRGTKARLGASRVASGLVRIQLPPGASRPSVDVTLAGEVAPRRR